MVARDFYGSGDHAGARGGVIHGLAPVNNTDDPTLQMGFHYRSFPKGWPSCGNAILYYQGQGPRG